MYIFYERKTKGLNLCTWQEPVIYVGRIIQWAKVPISTTVLQQTIVRVRWLGCRFMLGTTIPVQSLSRLANPLTTALKQSRMQEVKWYWNDHVDKMDQVRLPFIVKIIYQKDQESKVDKGKDRHINKYL